LTPRSLSVVLFTSARTWRGSSVSLAGIAAGLREHGHHVHMLAGDEAVVEGFARLGLPASRVPIGNTGVREARALARVLGDRRADAILVDRPRDLRLAALASLAHPLPIVNRYNLSRARPPADLLSRLAYRRVGLTVFVSQTSAARVLAFAGYIRRRPYRVIHGAVDTERFRPDAASGAAFRATHGLGEAQFVLAVGSLTLDKRYDFLLDVWQRMGRDAPPLVVCGQGAHGARLRGRVRELGLNVRLIGQLGPEGLSGAYAAATCFVHAGAVETFGLSVLEAMASGAAVLGVLGGAVPEVVGDAGVLVPVEDPATFAAQLRALLADPGRRAMLGQAARSRVLELFSLDRMRGCYVAAIESVCAIDRCASPS
jgi:glycosyltransferase involved in cell wall biosynthesis